MNRLHASFLVSLLILFVEAHALTVEEAYASIPHKRTVFDAQGTKIAPAQIETLKQIFKFSDQATVLRVEGLQSFQSGDLHNIKKTLVEYRSRLAAFSEQTATPELKPVQDLVRLAIT